MTPHCRFAGTTPRTYLHEHLKVYLMTMASTSAQSYGLTLPAGGSIRFIIWDVDVSGTIEYIKAKP
jgi:hypothetical protein